MEARGLFAQMAEALRHSHALDVVHRDRGMWAPAASLSKPWTMLYRMHGIYWFGKMFFFFFFSVSCYGCFFEVFFDVYDRVLVFLVVLVSTYIVLIDYYYYYTMSF